jgi:2,4-dienoyl-CoA reductase-like NADH-dependent reductase (Old Yellow Enzyme family)
MTETSSTATLPGEGPLLFQPIAIRGLTARNRIVVSPMCQYSSEDGGPTDWHLVHLGKFAMGGAGIVFGDETTVEARGRKTYRCAGIYSDEHVRRYQRITDFLKSQNAVPAIQLGHSGRKASCRPPWEGYAPLSEADAEAGCPPWQGVSSSPVAVSEAATVPHAMDRDDIRRLLAAWREAAQRSVDAGFDICEVHGAHGYLIHQFLSPIVNRRDDAYGGDRDGRMRLALEIVEAVRRVWPEDRPLFFRVSAVDGKGGHWDLKDTVALAAALKLRGVDVVDCSSGGISGPLTTTIVPRVPGYQVPFAERVRREAGIRTMAVGLITEPTQAEDILRQGKADLVALARELMLDPNWPVRAAAALGVENHLDLLPPGYAWWLRRREAILAVSREAAPAMEEAASAAQ